MSLSARCFSSLLSVLVLLIVQAFCTAPQLIFHEYCFCYVVLCLISVESSFRKYQILSMKNEFIEEGRGGFFSPYIQSQNARGVYACGLNEFGFVSFFADQNFVLPFVFVSFFWDRRDFLRQTSRHLRHLRHLRQTCDTIRRNFTHI